MVKEIWRDIPGYEGMYQVSSLGRVKSLKRRFRNGKWIKYKDGRILKQKTNKLNYMEVGFTVNGKKKYFLSHRLLAQAFIPNPENKPQVNHINGVKNDNRLENLEWATASENMLHAIDNSLVITPKGEGHYNSRLTRKDVLEIRARLFMGEATYSVARDFNVARKTISDVKLRKTWKHI